MKPTAAVLTLSLCMIAAACSGRPTEPPSQASADSSAKAPAAAGNVLRSPMPHIADGYPGVMTESAEVPDKTFYGIFHGDVSSDPLLIEHCFLVKTPSTVSGLTLKEFPNTLPLAETNDPKKTVYWHFARYPDGTMVPAVMNTLAFRQWFSSLIGDGNSDKFRHGVTFAKTVFGMPPEPGKEKNLEDSTAGIVESLSIPETGCRVSVFALEFTDVESKYPGSGLVNYDRQRRVLQAYSAECGKLKGADTKGKVARIEPVTAMGYGKWRAEFATGWDDMSYSDGDFLIDDDFSMAKDSSVIEKDTETIKKKGLDLLKR